MSALVPTTFACTRQSGLLRCRVCPDKCECLRLLCVLFFSSCLNSNTRAKGRNLQGVDSALARISLGGTFE